MPHHGYSRIKNALHCIHNLHTAFELEGITSALSHDAYGIAHSIHRVNLIAAERHVAYHKGTVDRTHNRACMVYHLVDGDGQRSAVSGHHIGCRIAYEDAVDAGTVNDTGCCEVV